MKKMCIECGKRETKTRSLDVCGACHLKAWRKENKERSREINNKSNQKRSADGNGKAVKAATKWRNENRKRSQENNKIAKLTRRTRKTKAGGSFTADEWRELCNHYGNVCLKCGSSEKLTADHIVAVANGGTSNIENIQPLCQSCNSSKGAKNTDYRGGNFLTRWIQGRLV